MKIGIRADASRVLGIGHFMRCLTLATELQLHGAIITWYAYMLGEHQKKILRKQNIELVQLKSPTAIECEQKLNTQNNLFDWFIIDMYSWGIADEMRIAKYTSKLLVIDDLANRSHWCDILLDQNESENKESRYDGLVATHTEKLFGCRYALLRKEFAALRDRGMRVQKEVTSILVSYGGTDPTNETIKTLRAIESLKLNMSTKIDIVVGLGNRFLREIQEGCRRNPNWILHVQTEQMAKIMNSSDIALCAGGTTTWERYCLGLPALVTIVADNQQEIVKFGERSGIDRCLGTASQVEFSHIQVELEKLISDVPGRYKSSGIAQDLVDGKGTERVVEHMLMLFHGRAN